VRVYERTLGERGPAARRLSHVLQPVPFPTLNQQIGDGRLRHPTDGPAGVEDDDDDMSLFPFWSHRSGSPRTWPEAEQWTDGGALELAPYAAALYEYAVQRIDRSSIHAWIVQRLVVDGEVDRSEAVRIADEVVPDEPSRSCARTGRQHAERGSYMRRPSQHRLSR
jgi:hypothetical protein